MNSKILTAIVAATDSYLIEEQATGVAETPQTAPGVPLRVQEDNLWELSVNVAVVVAAIVSSGKSSSRQSVVTSRTR